MLLALGASSWEVKAGFALSKWMFTDLLDLSRPKEIIEMERKSRIASLKLWQWGGVPTENRKLHFGIESKGPIHG